MASTDIAVPVAKAKGFLTITKEDIDALPNEVYREVLLQGFKSVFGRGQSKITADTIPDEAQRRKAAMEAAEGNWEACKRGEIRITGGKKKAGTGAIMTEARRLARQAVKDAIKADGGKISHYEASEITRLANELIEEDESYVAQATKNIEERKAKPVAIEGIMSKIKISEKKVAAANAKAKSKKVDVGSLSAKQGGLTAKARPQA